jgi:hypothetical protein
MDRKPVTLLREFISQALVDVLKEGVGLDDKKFGPALRKQVSDEYGEISEIHYERDKCEDENGRLISDPYYVIVARHGLVTCILSRDFTRIKEMHGPDPDSEEWRE